MSMELVFFDRPDGVQCFRAQYALSTQEITIAVSDDVVIDYAKSRLSRMLGEEVYKAADTEDRSWEGGRILSADVRIITQAAMRRLAEYDRDAKILSDDQRKGLKKAYEVVMERCRMEEFLGNKQGAEALDVVAGLIWHEVTRP